MVDDESDIFGKIKDEELPEGEGISIFQTNAPGRPGQDGADALRAHGEARERVDARVPRALQEVDDHRSPSRTTTRSASSPTRSGPKKRASPTENGWHTLYLYSRADVTGDYITDAAVQQDQSSGLGQYYVLVSFSPAGADRFEEVTGANVGKRFAIILDDVIDSAPVIKTKIGGGRATITMGAGDPEKQLADARKLELVLRSPVRSPRRSRRRTSRSSARRSGATRSAKA